MTSEKAAVVEAEELPAAEGATRRSRRPVYKDPLSALAWGVALASALACWYTFVRQHIPEPGERVARVTALVGSVRVKPGALEVWSDLEFEDSLHVGDVVQTEQLSGTELSFDTGSVVRVQPDSRIDLGGSAEQPTAAWRVQSGRVGFSVGDRVTRIVTPTVTTTAVGGTSGHLHVRASGDTRVKIFRGQAEVETTTGETITLLENEAVDVGAHGQAGERQVLPRPPKPLPPTIKAVPSHAAPLESTAELAWEPVIDAKTYRVSLDYNVTQANLQLSAALDAPGLTRPRHELAGLDTGSYFWRVAAVNEAGLEGAFSRVSSFRVGPFPELE